MQGRLYVQMDAGTLPDGSSIRSCGRDSTTAYEPVIDGGAAAVTWCRQLTDKAASRAPCRRSSYVILRPQKDWSPVLRAAPTWIYRRARAWQ